MQDRKNPVVSKRVGLRLPWSPPKGKAAPVFSRSKELWEVLMGDLVGEGREAEVKVTKEVY